MSVAGGGAGDLPRPALNAQPTLPLPKAAIPIARKADTAQITERKQWNTSNLGLRLGADASAAASASILVSPLICVIDRYVSPFYHASTPI